MNVEFKDVVDEVGERLGQDKAYVIDSSKARGQLNWAPRISLEKGIEEVVEWVGNHFDEMRKEPLEYNHKL